MFSKPAVLGALARFVLSAYVAMVCRRFFFFSRRSFLCGIEILLWNIPWFNWTYRTLNKGLGTYGISNFSSKNGCLIDRGCLFVGRGGGRGLFDIMALGVGAYLGESACSSTSESFLFTTILCSFSLFWSQRTRKQPLCLLFLPLLWIQKKVWIVTTVEPW